MLRWNKQHSARAEAKGGELKEALVNNSDPEPVKE